MNDYSNNNNTLMNLSGIKDNRNNNNSPIGSVWYE